MRGWMQVPSFGGIRQSYTPGKCFVCGTSQADRGVFCTGEYIGGEGINPTRGGKIQFCGECIKAAAALLGLIPSDVHERLDAAAAEHVAATARLAKAHAAIDAAVKKLL